jgi:predicted aldo/keto reductase-like oxidoreductase
MLGKRRLGRTGLEVSIIGFGGIPIMRVDPAAATRAIARALESGIDFIDTARGYGDSEQKIGQALSGLCARPVLASKSPLRDAEGLRGDFDTSLSNLGVESIDIYQLHCVNKDDEYDRALGSDGAYKALEELRREGRVRFIGLTSHNLDIIKRGIRSGLFDTVQVLYGVMDPEAEQEAIPMARDSDVGIIGMKPFAGGCVERYDLALKFALAAPGLVAIPGMATPEEVDENVMVAENPRRLTDCEVGLVSAMRARLGRVYCRRCDYCQPCPSEIPISFLLHIPTIRKRVGDPMMQTDAYRELTEKAGTCTDCGQCEERCPFDLPVRDLVKASRDILKEVVG